MDTIADTAAAAAERPANTAVQDQSDYLDPFNLLTETLQSGLSNPKATAVGS